MRRYSLTLLMILLVIALGLGAVACGSADVMTESGSYELVVTVDADGSQLPQGQQALGQLFLGQPIKIIGTFADKTDPFRADITLGLALADTNVGVGLRAIDDNAWLSVLGKWYRLPAASSKKAGDANYADMAKTFRQAVDEQGIDLTTWIKEPKAPVEETLAGIKVTHLAGTLDVKKVAADLLALMANPKMAKLMTSAESAGSTTGVTVPDSVGKQELEVTLQQMIKSATLDLWVAKSDPSVYKIVLNSDIVIPAEMGMSGVNGAKLVFTIARDAPSTKVVVKAPKSAKPIADLLKDLQSNPLFSGLLGGFMGSGSGSGSGGALAQ